MDLGHAKLELQRIERPGALGACGRLFTWTSAKPVRKRCPAERHPDATS